jgi:hypothetical protein
MWPLEIHHLLSVITNTTFKKVLTRQLKFRKKVKKKDQWNFILIEVIIRSGSHHIQYNLIVSRLKGLNIPDMYLIYSRNGFELFNYSETCKTKLCLTRILYKPNIK